MSLEQNFYALLDRVGALDWKVGDHHRDAILDEARDLVEHGEMGVALEHICQYLYEYSVNPGAEELKILRRLADAMKMPRSTWSLLEGPRVGRKDGQC